MITLQELDGMVSFQPSCLSEIFISFCAENTESQTSLNYCNYAESDEDGNLINSDKLEYHNRTTFESEYQHISDFICEFVHPEDKIAFKNYFIKKTGIKISDIAQTGVINGNKVDWDAFSNFMDRNYLETQWNIFNDIKSAMGLDKTNIELDSEILDLVSTYMDKYWNDSSSTIHLYGDWKLDKDTDKYVVDELDSKYGFSAIYDSNNNIFQIVWSKYVIENRGKCSPCYPNQLDLESDNGYGVAYSFPLDNYSTNFINEISNKFYDFSK